MNKLFPSSFLPILNLINSIYQTEQPIGGLFYTGFLIPYVSPLNEKKTDRNFLLE